MGKEKTGITPGLSLQQRHRVRHHLTTWWKNGGNGAKWHWHDALRRTRHRFCGIPTTKFLNWMETRGSIRRATKWRTESPAYTLEKHSIIVTECRERLGSPWGRRPSWHMSSDAPLEKQSCAPLPNLALQWPWHQVGDLKLARMGILTPWKLGATTSQGFFFLPLHQCNNTSPALCGIREDEGTLTAKPRLAPNSTGHDEDSQRHWNEPWGLDGSLVSEFISWFWGKSCG